MLFFMLIINVIISIIYILYVFFTIKIYQDIPERRITKKEFVAYNLKLGNESIIAYRDIRMQFMKELSEVKGAEKIGNMVLAPGQVIDVDMELFCKYSGTYFIGVDTIEVMDYFRIFRIRFHMPQKMKVTVKPRILKPETISFITEDEECRNSGQKGQSVYLLDNEVRKYVSGDNKRRIHWKNSARRQELMVRNQTAEEISEYVVIMDGQTGLTDFESKIILCDKLRETVIALVYYIYCSGYNVLSVLDNTFEREIYSQRDFDEFYNRLIDYGFGMKKDFNGLLLELNRKVREEIPFIIISAQPAEICGSTWNEIKCFRNIHVVDVSQFEDIEEFLNR